MPHLGTLSALVDTTNSWDLPARSKRSSQTELIVSANHILDAMLGILDAWVFFAPTGVSLKKPYTDKVNHVSWERAKVKAVFLFLIPPLYHWCAQLLQHVDWVT